MTEKHNITEDHQRWDWLSDLLDRPFWPLENLINLLGQYEEYDDFVGVLTRLVESAKADMVILGKVLIETFGPIQIEVIRPQKSCQPYEQSDFGKAFIEPRQEDQGGAA